MYYSSKQERVTSDRKLVAGIEKNLGKSTSIVLNGRKMKMSELLAMIEQRIEAADVVETARVAWQAVVDKEQATVGDTQPFVDALRAYLVATLGEAPAALTDYGITVRKRRVPTSEQLADRAKKARSTRKARRSAGAAIVASPAPVASPVASPPALPPTNGGT